MSRFPEALVSTQAGPPTQAIAAQKSLPLNRIGAIDALRGLAAGGMLVVNLGIFSGVAFIPFAYTSRSGQVIRFLVLALAEGKFYPIFAFLFGWGVARQIAQQLKRAGSQPMPFSPLRRITLLGLLGMAHAFFFWSGDILLPYAFLGLILLIMRKVRTPVLLATAGFSLLLASVLALPNSGSDIFASYIHWISPALAHLAPPRPDLLHPTAGFWLAVQGRLWETIARLLFFPTWLGAYFAFVLLGFLAGREGWLEKLSRLSLAPGRKAMLGGILFAGLGLNILYALVKINLLPCPDPVKPFWEKLLPALGGPLLAAGYALGIAALHQSTRMRKWLQPLARLGQMSLTAYLSQSAACSILFSAYGFGLYGRMDPLDAAALVCIINLAQLAFSWLWMGRFRNGPLEGLLKKGLPGPE